MENISLPGVLLNFEFQTLSQPEITDSVSVLPPATFHQCCRRIFFFLNKLFKIADSYFWREIYHFASEVSPRVLYLFV